jgi:hypothetical protein
MAKQKERVQICNIANDTIVRACLECLEKNCDGIAIYTDYNPLQYPLITIHLIALPSENMPQELAELIGEVIMEITANLDAIQKLGHSTSDVLESLFNLRIRCSNGWIMYGYVAARSQYGIPYTTKTWLYIPASKIEASNLQLGDEELRTVIKLVYTVIEKAKRVLELEVL